MRKTKQLLSDTQLALVQLYQFVQTEFESERYPITHYLTDDNAASAALVAIREVK